MDIERLRELDEEAAEWIEENCGPRRIRDSPDLSSLFIWRNTPQGHGFWRDLDTRMQSQERKPAMDKQTISKEITIKLHRLQWNEIAEKGLQYKNECSIWKHNGGIIDIGEIYNECFLCHYVKQKPGVSVGHIETIGTCKTHCPLEWPLGACFGSENALFWRWNETKLKETALQIANLPEKLSKKPDKEIFLKATLDRKQMIGKDLLVMLCDEEGNNYMTDGSKNGSNLFHIDLRGKRTVSSSFVNPGAQRVSGLEFTSEGELKIT